MSGTAAPGRYRKRPVEVEARQLVDDDACDWDAIAKWCGGRIYNVESAPGAEPRTQIDIRTLEGTMTAREGDWIIRGVKGEFYPCREDIFAATYEPADDHDDDGRHPDGCTCQFCREDEREERDREELDDDTDNTIPDTEGSDW